MRTVEIALLTAGSVLFVFSLVLMILLLKKDKPYIKAIWLIIIAFFMMGFSSISQAEIFGLFKYEKEKKLTELQFLADALDYCPDNTEIKKELSKKTEAFVRTEKVTKPEESAVLSSVYLTLEDQSKAIKYADKTLLKEPDNTKAKAVKDIVETQDIISKIPNSDDKKVLIKQYKTNIQLLKANPDISKNRIDNVQRFYSYKMDSLRRVSQ